MRPGKTLSIQASFPGRMPKAIENFHVHSGFVFSAIHPPRGLKLSVCCEKQPGTILDGSAVCVGPEIEILLKEL
jgi:hypothetical protein